MNAKREPQEPAPLIDATIIRGLMQDWYAINAANTYVLLSMMADLPYELVTSIANDRRYITQDEAGRILAALREPLRPELLLALKRVQRRI